ncbi:MAG: hypothetical protein OXB92_03040 [Acidimicrobiaceae bacterium]|nr:hypothetical protein [Acidimicrobiia bacterium]MCY4492818.1 hypothetical protein [Acidimicrobiaceae bacterium]
MSKSLFPAAIRAGTAVCVVVSVPAAVAQAVLAGSDGDEQSNWVYLTLLAIIVAYLAGGAVAGRMATAAPMINGAAAAVAAFAVVQLVAGVVRIAGGDGINPLALVFNVLLAASIGTVGAGIGAHLSNRAKVNA